jgi:hypothetical protein
MKNEERETGGIPNSSFEIRNSKFNALYALVLIELAITIAILYAFTAYFR